MAKNAKKTAKSNAKEIEEDFWYTECETWFLEKFNYPDRSKLKFGTITRRWFEYDEEFGYFKHIDISKMRGYFFEWAGSINFKTTSQNTNHLIQRLESLYSFDEKWNPDKHLENTIDYVIDLEKWDENGYNRVYYQHDPAFLFDYVVPRHYKLEGPNLSGISMWKHLIQEVTNDWENFLKFLIAVVHKNHSDEIMMFAYGPAGAGKSTILQTLGNLYGKENTSDVKISRMGSRFATSGMYQKRINVAPDNLIMPINAYIIAYIKETCESNATMEIEIKGITPFSVDVDWFQAFGINQLMPIESRYAQEIDSIMRRLLLIHCPKRRNRDTELKDMFLDPDFLDDIYTWAVNQSYVPIIDNLNEHIRCNTERYFADSDPILRICQENFHYTGDERDGLFVTECLDILRECLTDEGYPIPVDINAQLTQKLRIMKIDRNDKLRGAKARYVRCKLRDIAAEKLVLENKEKMSEFSKFNESKLEYLSQFTIDKWDEESKVYDEIFGSDMEITDTNINKVRDKIIQEHNNK